MMEQIFSLAEDLKLDEEQTNSLRTFVILQAREQYKMGSRAGAAWAFKQAKEKQIA